MPRTSDYSLGKIYKLMSNQSDDIYIGSTCQKLLSKRFQGHKNKYNSWLNRNCKYETTSFELLKHEDCQIVLIENYPCSSKYELEARERQYIETTKCINKYIPTRSQHEYAEDNKEKLSAYYQQSREDHKDRINERNQQRYHANQEAESARKKKFREDNKEHVKLMRREEYLRNKHKTHAKVECEVCGASIIKCVLKRHQLTEKIISHQNNDTELKQNLQCNIYIYTRCFTKYKAIRNICL